MITNLRVDLRLQLYCLPAGGGDSDGDDCSRHIVTLSAFLHPRPAPSLPPSRGESNQDPSFCLSV